MTLKIEKTADEYGTIIKLIGRIRREELANLKSQIPVDVLRVALDLTEVSLVDTEAYGFLAPANQKGFN